MKKIFKKNVFSTIFFHPGLISVSFFIIIANWDWAQGGLIANNEWAYNGVLWLICDVAEPGPAIMWAYICCGLISRWAYIESRLYVYIIWYV